MKTLNTIHDAGPYQAPVDVYSKKEPGKEPNRTMKYWIRPASLTAGRPWNKYEEETIVNAVLHKNDKENVPIEIRIYVDQIQIINFPRPEHYIDMEKFAAGKVRARRYRNPKIGELFRIDLVSKKH